MTVPTTMCRPMFSMAFQSFCLPCRGISPGKKKKNACVRVRHSPSVIRPVLMDCTGMIGAMGTYPMVDCFYKSNGLHLHYYLPSNEEWILYFFSRELLISECKVIQPMLFNFFIPPSCQATSHNLIIKTYFFMNLHVAQRLLSQNQGLRNCFQVPYECIPLNSE